MIDPRKVAVAALLVIASWSAQADLRVQQLFGFAKYSAILQVSNTDSESSTSDLTTYTFSAKSLGSADSNRLIVVGAGGRSTSNGCGVSTATIGGVSATIIASATVDDGGNSICADLVSAVVPTGTTGDVVITFSVGMARAGIGVWRIEGLPYGTAHDTQTDTTGDPMSWTLDVPPRGIGIGVSFATGGAQTWTGLTEDYDLDMESNRNSGASIVSLTGNSALGVTNTHGGGTQAGVVVSWKPIR